MHEERGWEYMFWDDEKLSKLPGIPQLPSMLSEHHTLVKQYTDSIRIYLLHRYGGVYLDIDAYCLQPFDPLLGYMEEDGGKDFLANYESERLRGRQVANGVFIAAPMSPVLSANALHVGIKLFANPIWKTVDAFRGTGPWSLTELKTDWFSWIENHQTILSSSAFIPLYKDEGAGMTLEDYMKYAEKKGSYTIQMYQSTKERNSVAMIKQDNENNIEKKAEEETTEDVEEMPTVDISNDIDDPGHEFRRRDTSLLVPSSQEPSILMIVSHPDDETLFAGSYLTKESQKVHVVVTCTKNPETGVRREEFMAVAEMAGFHGEFLDGKDTTHPGPDLEPAVKERIQNLICGDKTWDRIITHGPEGEYGHPQHQLVHDAVAAAAKKCTDAANKLYVFEPRPDKDYVFPKAKAMLAEVYKSQSNVLEQFKNWREQIVPLQQYDYAKASTICMTNALGHKNRKCRLDDVLHFASSPANNDQAEAEKAWAEAVKNCKQHKSISCHKFKHD